MSEEMIDKITQFKKLLLKWNNTINLISSKTVHHILDRHILDSVQLLPFIDKKSKIIDLGSGAGFPGIILSIAGVPNITLVESNTKKVAFLVQAASISSHNINIIHDRIENTTNLQCDIITARAFAELEVIFECSTFIKVRNKFLLHKGARYQNEISQAKNNWCFNYNVYNSITSKMSSILEITHLIRKL